MTLAWRSRPMWFRAALMLVLALSTAAAGWSAYALLFDATDPSQSSSEPDAPAHRVLRRIIRITDRPDDAAFLAAIAEVQRHMAAVAPAETGDDERLPMAFDLLSANKRAAATRLLQAIARDKPASDRTGRSDAIVAYRTLGDIAETPQQALDAYARAIEIDPNDIGSLLGGGWIVLQQGLLGEAERRFRRALPLMAGETQPWNRFRVRLGLGSDSGTTRRVA